jgi:hypothetical protein
MQAQQLAHFRRLERELLDTKAVLGRAEDEVSDAEQRCIFQRSQSCYARVV